MNAVIHLSRAVPRFLKPVRNVRCTKAHISQPMKPPTLMPLKLTIARFRAIVSFKGIKVGGFIGWLMWAFVHLTFLTGFKNRGTALLKWITAFIGSARDERTITIQQASARIIAMRANVRPGEEDLSRFVDERSRP